MENKDLDLQKKRTKRAKIIDITLFILCMINLILWLIRAGYAYNIESYTAFAWVYDNLFTPMYYALYALPIVLVLSFINRRITLDSFSFLSIKCLAITYILIFIIK